MERNELFTVVCQALNVTAKFEVSGKGSRPSVSTKGLAGAYAHLLCNPKNAPLVEALLNKGIDGAWFVAPKKFGEYASYRAFLYACGTSVRDVRNAGNKHVSADSITGKVDQSADWITWCQAEASLICQNKAAGIAQSIREGRVNSANPTQVVKAGIQLKARDAIQLGLSKQIVAGKLNSLQLIAPKSVSKNRNKAVGE